MDQKHSAIQKNVIRVSVIAESEGNARQKASEYLAENGYNRPRGSTDVIKNEYTDNNYIVYCNGVDREE